MAPVPVIRKVQSQEADDTVELTGKRASALSRFCSRRGCLPSPPAHLLIQSLPDDATAFMKLLLCKVLLNGGYREVLREVPILEDFTD